MKSDLLQEKCGKYVKIKRKANKCQEYMEGWVFHDKMVNLDEGQTSLVKMGNNHRVVNRCNQCELGVFCELSGAPGTGPVSHL